VRKPDLRHRHGIPMGFLRGPAGLTEKLIDRRADKKTAAHSTVSGSLTKKVTFQ
jgi:hypothetical protein